jgi:hypothetical protein
MPYPLNLRRLLALSVAALVILVSTTRAPVAYAALGGCRTDPVVILSDGTILDVSVEIDVSVSNVETIQYVVHGPRGVRLVAAISTPTIGFNGKELFTYVEDAGPNQYITDTFVTTKPDGIRVTSYTTFAGLGSSSKLGLLALQYHPISGFNEQHLIATLIK